MLCRICFRLRSLEEALTVMCASVMARVRSKVVKLTDQRVKAVSEVVTGIKVRPKGVDTLRLRAGLFSHVLIFLQAIKLYAWEEPYIKRLCDCRDQELRQVQKSATLEGLNFMLFSAGPILITMAAFGVYAALGKTLTASVAFPALAFFNLLRFPIILLPMQITSIINAKVMGFRCRTGLGREDTAHLPLRVRCAGVSETYPGLH